MIGALPSVVGGLVKVPVIAVPTSVGYGASFGGVAALLGMLNSCADDAVCARPVVDEDRLPSVSVRRCRARARTDRYRRRAYATTMRTACRKMSAPRTCGRAET
jgi:hypothetical protein